ncbi:MAG TPA: DUF4149 domain-containing protein [Nitrospira sp.]|nr:DUF4149 domain-containing protein [Nitrospira sp.]
MLALILVWLHLIAAISWIGGMIFLSLVLAPLIRRQNSVPELMVLFRSAARRFRIVVWAAIIVLVATGPVLLHQRGLSIADPTRWPRVFETKITLVGILLLLTLLHDLLLGPQIIQISAIPEEARTTSQQTLVRTARWLPRLSLCIALAVVVAAVVLSRS